MKYKNYRKYSSLLVIVFAVLFVVCSCKKTDDTYKNYKNMAGNFNGSALAYLQSQQGTYDSMLLVIDRLGDIADTLSTKNITLFAVSNGSFALALKNINQARMDSIPSMPPVSLNSMDLATLDTFFCRYIIRGKIPTDSLINFTDGLFYPSVKNDYRMQLQFTQTNASGYLKGGPKAIIFSDPKGSIFTINWIRATTATVDVKTQNAIVHLLPPGHDFGFGADFVRAVNKR